MNELLSFILTLVLNYGYPIIVGVILLGYLGLPISLNILLVAAGAFASDGTLNIYYLIPLVSLVALFGDIFNYLLGKKFGYLLINRFSRKVGITENRLNQMRFFLEQWGRWLIFSSRFLFTPIGIPVNLIAGITSYSFRTFMIFAFVGEVIWACMYLLIGYWLGTSWVALISYINQTPQIIFFVGFGLLLLILSYRMKGHYH